MSLFLRRCSCGVVGLCKRRAQAALARVLRTTTAPTTHPVFEFIPSSLPPSEARCHRFSSHHQ
ncbi:hypothetical protein CC86DRAFT_198774 [Ophiobolus disseminans]|uniref:Uncharacterized protein n=1 Tax=Ophiobolus disseminans TaxID=1469910 RepID=A0A6A7A8A5_9PLEO|nr:hypothetical protein CC86DRAFT_198774 [Ophiobolus disseminans]